jgi:hypothetical protein
VEQAPAAHSGRADAAVADEPLHRPLTQTRVVGSLGERQPRRRRFTPRRGERSRDPFVDELVDCVEQLVAQHRGETVARAHDSPIAPAILSRIARSLASAACSFEFAILNHVDADAWANRIGSRSACISQPNTNTPLGALAAYEKPALTRRRFTAYRPARSFPFASRASSHGWHDAEQGMFRAP